jgi:hypothetical protein
MQPFFSPPFSLQAEGRGAPRRCAAAPAAALGPRAAAASAPALFPRLCFTTLLLLLLAATASAAVCPAGQYFNNASLVCTSCPGGRYNDRAGGRSGASLVDDCIGCPECMRADQGSVYCSAVSPGYYLSAPLAGVQSPCPHGTYSLFGACNASGCLPCPFCTRNTAPGQTMCYPPDAGWFVINAANQGRCPIGRFSQYGTACDYAGCLQCPNCTKNHADGADRCYPPDQGYFINAPGMQALCPSGRYSQHGSACDYAGCLPCPNGTQSSAGSPSCYPCVPIPPKLPINVRQLTPPPHPPP